MFKTAFGILLALFLIGDIIGLIGLVWVLFRDRDRGRIYWCFSALLLSVVLFFFIWLSASGEIPADARTLRYRITILIAAVVLALGVWQAVLHVIFGLWRETGNTNDAITSGDKPSEYWIVTIGQIVRDELARFFKNGKK